MRNKLLRRSAQVPGVADARIQQSFSAPSFDVDVDRTRAQDAGLTARDVTNSLVVSLAGASQVAPTYWLNPANGVSYRSSCRRRSTSSTRSLRLQNLPISAGGPQPQNARRHRDIIRAAAAMRWSRIQYPADDPDLRHACRTAISAPWQPTSSKIVDELSPRLPRAAGHAAGQVRR